LNINKLIAPLVFSLLLSPASVGAGIPMGVSSGTTFLGLCGDYPNPDKVIESTCDIMVRELATSIWFSHYLMGSEPYCLETSHSTQQYVYVIRNFLEDNPVYINKPHVIYIKAALSKAFPPPCN
jgi:hypothetical protein